MLKKILLYFALLLWFVVPSSAQPTIIASEITAQSGDIVDIEFKAVNFVNLTTMQFSINWNKDVLKFRNVGNYQLEYLSDDDFGTVDDDGANGFLRLLWVDDSTEGQTIADSTVFMTVSFEIIGAPATESIIEFTNSPLAIEFSIDGVAVDHVLDDGMVIVEETNAILSLNNSKTIALYQNYPNPFDNYTVIRFDLASTQDITLNIYDINGTLIWTKAGSYGQGTHSLEINEHQFPSAGTFVYELVTNDDLLTKKMFLIK